MGEKPEFGNLTIILPTLNEEDSIGETIEEGLKACPGARILVVDDDSTDSTGEKVRALQNKGLPVQLIVRKEGTRGLTASLIEGIQASQTEHIAVMDADLQHPPEKLPELVKALDSSDLAIGVREEIAGRWPLPRMLMSSGATFLAYFRLRVKGRLCADPLSGFFAMKKKLFEKHCQKRAFAPQGYKILFDILKQLPKDTRIAEVPYTFNKRRRGKSKIGSKHMLSFLRSLVT